MAYQVLARKWRPQSFQEMVGQDHVLKALVNALDQDRLHHAYLFTGTRGVGKTTIARIFARCLNCEQGVSSTPCGECSACREIAEGRSVDLLEVDAASRTKVEDTRELLDNVQYAPTHARFKVYLIDEVHMLSTHSFNALLKTLEEPPPHVKFLLATTDPQKLPATVLSRCLQFNLKNMPPEQVVGHLASILKTEGVDYEEPALWLLGRAAAGSMRDALSLTDQAIAFGSGAVTESDVRSMLGSVDLTFVYRLLKQVQSGDPAAVLDTISNMNEHGLDFAASLDELISLIHRVSLAQAVPDAIDNRWGDREKVIELAGALTAEDAQLYYQVALNGKRDLELAPDARSGFEMLLLRMIAFRPDTVIDVGLEGSDLSAEATTSQGQPAASEGGPPVKKSRELTAASRAEEGRPSVRSSREAESREDSQPKPQPQQIETAQEPAPLRAKPISIAYSDASVPAGHTDVEDISTRPQSASAEAQSLATLEADNWWQVLSSLELSGIVASVASNCCVKQCTESEVVLMLDERNAALYNETHAAKIGQALAYHFGSAPNVLIELGMPESETPSMRRERLQRERQQAAVVSIEGDARLQQLIARFDGELEQGSIKPLDS